MPKVKFALAVATLIASSILSAPATHSQSTRPDSEKQRLHDIYKQFIEIQSGYNSGSTTPVAEAAASRLKAAGFPDSDIHVGGAIDKKANLVVRYHGIGAQNKADPPARPHRCRRS